jgi:hypothetical protein
MTSVFFLFLLHASLGLLAMLPFVPARAGARFFKFCSGTAAFMATAGLGLLVRRFGTSGTAAAGQVAAPHPLAGAGTALSPAEAPGADGYVWLLATAGAMLIFSVLYNRAEHFGWSRPRRPLLLAAILAGAGATVAGAAPGPRVFLALTGLASAWLIGAAATAMILGHWYLVVLDLPITALRRLTVLLVIGLGLRTLVVAYALAGPVQAGLEHALAVAGGEFDPDGIFVWMRLLFGLLGPLSLIWFIWKTVEIRSTQSATGILYIQLFLVMAGELLATYLRITAGLAL